AVAATLRRRASRGGAEGFFGARLALGLAGLASAFLALETAAQLSLPEVVLEIAPDSDSPVPIAEKDPQVRGRFTPGFHGRFLDWSYRGIPVRINRQGFRDRPWPAPGGGPRAVRRILAVGDSFTFGTGV